MSGSLTDQMPDPTSNPNDSKSYVPSPATSVVAPVIAQITGGNAGNTVAGVQGSVKADNSFFGNIGSIVSDVSSKLGAAYNAGIATGSSPQAIAGKVDELATAKAQSILQAGASGAQVIQEDALHKAAAADATAKDAVRLGLDPNNPEAIAGMEAVRKNAADVFKYTGQLADMRNVGFFDNPAAYLVNHIINIPMATDRAQGALVATKEAAGAISAQTESLRDRTVVDSALNSVDTTSRATNLYNQALQSATAEGITPLIQAKQISISAYELGVAQQNATTSAANLAISQAKLPGELALQKSQIEYYGAYHDALIDQAKARSDEMVSAMQKRERDAQGIKDNLTAVNGVYNYLGLDGGLKDLGLLRDKQKTAMFEMASNLQTGGQLAQTPAKAIELIRDSGVSLDKIPAGQLPTVKNLDTLYNSSVEKALAIQPGESKPTGQALQDRVHGYMTQSLLEEQRKGFDTNNKFFTMPSAGTLVDRPWASKNPIVQALRPLAVDSSGQAIRRDVDGSLLLNTAANLVKKGTLTEGQAVQALRDAGENILNDVQTAGGFKRFGIPVQKNFSVNYQKSGFTFGSAGAKADLLDSSQTLNAIRRQVGGLTSVEAMSETPNLLH